MALSPLDDPKKTGRENVNKVYKLKGHLTERTKKEKG